MPLGSYRGMVEGVGTIGSLEMLLARYTRRLLPPSLINTRWPRPEFREFFFEIWAVAGFANFASKFGQIWRTAVFRERFVVRSRRRTDGYTHSPLRSRAAWDRLLVERTRLSTDCGLSSLGSTIGQALEAWSARRDALTAEHHGREAWGHAPLQQACGKVDMYVCGVRGDGR